MTSLIVTTLNDTVDAFDGQTSLREAVAYANIHAGVDTITFTTGPGTIRLTNAAGTLVASEALIINGDIDNDNAPDITITGDAAGNDATVAGGITDIFASGASLTDNVAIIYSTGSASLTFNGVVLTGGVIGGSGGAINSAHDLTLTNSIVSGNQSFASGGAISVFDDATLTNVVLSGNQSVNDTGGGILVINGTLNLTDSTVSGNSANGDGGGISSLNTTILRSTISGNIAGGSGGGMFIYGDADITNSTISGNTVGIAGGGMMATTAELTNVTVSGNKAVVGGGGVYTNLDATVTNSTITGNDGGAEGGGIDVDTGTLVNSIVMGNAAANGADTFALTSPFALTGGNIIGTDVFSGGSVIDSTTLAGVFAAVGLDPNTSLLSGVLANNGGLVQTVALNADALNPALDASDGTAPAADARDIGRTDHSAIANGTGGTGADLGAFEALNAAPSGTDNTITIDEDEGGGFGYEFSSADFGFSDADGDNFESVVISSLPLNGVLFNDLTGLEVQAGDVIDVADIDNGALFFIPDPDENGAGYTDFTFQVVDDGGTTGGGEDTDQSANTITFDVTPVNDAPRIFLQPALDVVGAEPDSDGVAIASGDGEGFLYPNGGEFTGTGPEHVVLADLNGDGYLDIVTSNKTDNTVTVLLGEGCGCFDEATGSPIAVGSAPGGMVVGFFNNDLIPDLVVVNTGDNSVTALIGNGDGTFTTTSSPLFFSGTVKDVAAADFNEDGKLDIVRAGAAVTTGNLAIAFGNGSGGFRDYSTLDFGSPTDIVDVETASLNGDTHADIVGVDRLNDRVLVFFEDGTGLAPDNTILAAGDAPEDAAVGDVNGDGKLDIVVANSGDDNIGVFLGNGAGSFAAQVAYIAGDGPTTLALADMNEDGDLDIVAGHQDGSFHVLLGKGDGTFTPDPFPLFSNYPVSEIAVGNIDPDAEDLIPLIKQFTEGQTLALAPRLVLSDIDGTTITGASVVITDGLAGDVLGAAAIAGISVSYDPGTFTLTLSSLTPQSIADYQQVLRSVTFASGDNPDDFGNQPFRTIEVTVDDGGLDGEGLSAPIGLLISAVDDPAVAVNDAFVANENAAIGVGFNVFAANSTTADSDPDNDLSVIAVNGSGAAVGFQVTLASGALLKLNADGTFSYNPNHAFDALPAFVGSGASNTTATDSFTYTLAGGSTATVTVTIRGVDSNDLLQGTISGDTLNGGIGNDTIEAGGKDDLLYGGIGNDILDGGAGLDKAAGGAGNDTYVIDSVDDEADESQPGSDGIDTVKSSVASVLLANLGHFKGAIENILLEGGSNLNASGNGGANAITGNAGNNAVTGGAGNDTLRGGDGTDYLGGGGDNDVLYGGIGNDTLEGGTGLDKAAGGAGDDTYIIDNLDDEIDESLPGSDGIDTVRSSLASVVLTNQGHFKGAIENIVLEGSSNLNATGNAEANTITGNAGNNTLDGRLGADILNGLGGADSFRFSTALSAANIDQIRGYDVANNVIYLDKAVFAGLQTGQLNSNAFYTGAAAHDLDDRIIYDRSHAALLFDADGNQAGGVAAIQFATLSNSLAMSAGEFFVI